MAHDLYENLIDDGYTFFTGVPDSALKVFQNTILVSDHQHVIATNEGQAVGIAVGAELAGKKACVYLQNSGLGNIINPLTSLCIPHGIFPHLVIGHRHTLPQHKVMGEVDEKMLDLIGYTNYTIVRGENNAN
jgi:phosphonopyruvate decarboxylase|tara:strand:- start:127 stop:522 length:396 start_codon:yes stop_codon:yes gene_type:complete